LCRGAGVESLALVGAAPAGYTVRVDAHEGDQFRWRVQVECAPATAVREAALRFVARQGGRDVPLAQRVSVAPAN
jgi:hypothetical protein